MQTRFTRLVGCELPLQLAVLGGVGTTELAAAVASVGGLGMVPGGVELPDDTCGATGSGFILAFAPSLNVVAEAARHCRVVEFFYGAPSAEYVAAAHAGGALCSWQTGSVDEALAAERAGCDFIVAQGREAGGHLRGDVPLRELIERVVTAVGVPVVAAGGLATAEAVARIVAAGADAVRIGTAFVAAAESAAHPAYQAALIRAGGADETEITTHFDRDWPDAPHRVLRRALARAKLTGNRRIDPPSRYATGDVSDMAMYAGEGVGAVTAVRPAREIALELMSALA